MAKVICVANFKGGLGKSSLSTTINAIFNAQNKGKHKSKSLLIDADGQCNSTDTYRALTKDVATLYDVILDLDDPLDINEAIQHTEIGDIIAADPLLKESDLKFPNDGNEYFRLKDALEALSDEYQYVVIDTAPADNKLLKNCLIAADKVIIPITADRYALQGLSELNKTIQTIKKRSNPGLEIAGLLLVKYKERQTLSKEVKEALENIAKQMNTKVFKTTIRESVVVPKSQAQRTTLIDFDKNAKVTKDYIDFVAELMKEV